MSFCQSSYAQKLDMMSTLFCVILVAVACKYISAGETRPLVTPITSTATPETSSCYIVQCNRCLKQYIEETERQLKDSEFQRTPWTLKVNNSNIFKPTTVSEH